MNPRRFPRQAIALATMFLLVAALPAIAAPNLNGKLQIIHLDANQGDAAVIITPGGQVVLIDDGNNTTNGSPTSCAQVLTQLQNLGVTYVDLHFASHYHADHIGCLTNLVNAGIVINQGWDRGSTYTTGTYTNYANELSGVTNPAHGNRRHTLVKGQTFTLDSLMTHPVTITCVDLNSPGSTTSDENANSVVLRVSYGEFDESFGGDLSGDTGSGSLNIEPTIGPEMGKVEALKVNHHGSATSTNDAWLNAIAPKVAFISCGNNNSYGHPTVAALTRIHNHFIRSFWTHTGAASAAVPDPAWDKVANAQIRINAVWQPAGVDSIYFASTFADTFTNSGSALDVTPPSVSLTAPHGGETLPTGSSTSITWTASDNIAVTTVDVDYSLNNGGSWTNLATGVANSGSQSWSVPNTPSTQGLARVTAHDAAGNSAAGTSASNFTVADQELPTVAVTSPNGGENYAPSSTQNITWTAADNVAVDSINVDYSLHGVTGPWVAVQHALSNSGTVSWGLPAQSTDSAVVRVSAFDHALNQRTDLSDALFRIQVPVVGLGLGGPARFSLYPAVPNPSHGTTRLRFSLEAVGDAWVTVMDVSGRQMWRGGAGNLSAGEHGVEWDGRDMHGAPAGSGVYFVRLTSGSRSMTSKFVLLR